MGECFVSAFACRVKLSAVNHNSLCQDRFGCLLFFCKVIRLVRSHLNRSPILPQRLQPCGKYGADGGRNSHAAGDQCLKIIDPSVSNPADSQLNHVRPLRPLMKREHCRKPYLLAISLGGAA